MSSKQTFPGSQEPEVGTLWSTCGEGPQHYPAPQHSEEAARCPWQWHLVVTHRCARVQAPESARSGFGPSFTGSTAVSKSLNGSRLSISLRQWAVVPSWRKLMRCPIPSAQPGDHRVILLLPPPNGGACSLLSPPPPQVLHKARIPSHSILLSQDGPEGLIQPEPSPRPPIPDP